MVNIRRDVPSEDVQQSARHVLFVEGSGPDALDPTVLATLLDNRIRVEPLGPCYSIKSVAEALHEHHPSYYFLIDRDHRSQAAVDRSWEAFPDPDTSNLLIWPRKELENYFVDPQYLSRSEFLHVGECALRDTIRDRFQQRLYMCVANMVIIEIRERLKAKWIDVFTNPGDLGSRDEAVRRLQRRREWTNYQRKTRRNLERKYLEGLYDRFLHRMTGGRVPLEYGEGHWEQLMPAKAVFAEVMNSNCFSVEDREGGQVVGPEKAKEVAKQLVSLELDDQPPDFSRLHQLVMERVLDSQVE